MTAQPQNPAPITVEDLCNRVAAAEDLPPRRRLEISGDLRRACDLVPGLAQSRADGRVCTPKLVALSAAKTGLTVKRIQNIRASIKAAFRWNARKFPKGSGRPQLGPDWTVIFTALGDDIESTRRLSRLAHTCQRLGIMPMEINDSTLEAYLEYSVTVELLGDPDKARRLIVRHWAKAIHALPDLGLQALTPPAPIKKGMAPKIEEFGEPFRTTFEAYVLSMEPFSLNDTCDKPRFDETIPKADVKRFKGYRPSVIVQRQHLLRQAGGLLASATGRKLKSILLRDLVRPANVTTILAAHHKSLGYREAIGIGTMATALRALATTYFKVSVKDREALESLVRQCPKQKFGMVRKNRDRLQQIGVTEMDIIFDLPRRLIEDAQRKIADGTFLRKDYISAQIGAAIGLLLEGPVRGSNLASIRLDEHLTLTALRGAAGRLRFAADETKNLMELDFPLSKELVALLTIFVREIRPQLDREGESAALFPGRSNDTKGVSHLGGQIAKTIMKATGVKMNQHLFRHLLAILYLERHPGQYGVVKVLLGHKKLETTMDFYCGLEVEATLKHFADVMGRMRGEADVRRKNTRRRGPGNRHS